VAVREVRRDSGGREPADYYTFSYKVNVKVKLSLCLTKHHAMKAYWGVEV
jgi:hypothetical protein